MIRTDYPEEPDRIPASALSAVFSNYTRCPTCRSTGGIRVHYDPGCAQISGPHFHRECPCGATWAERSAGHASLDINLDNPAFVAICQHCQTRHDHQSAMQPQCCRRAEVSYHDVREPCELCSDEREPGVEG